jgi:hypothetical protein
MFANHFCDSLREGNLNERAVRPRTRAGVTEKMGLIADVDQLGGDANLPRSQARASFKGIVDVQTAPASDRF